jgi:hypothetical protein
MFNRLAILVEHGPHATKHGTREQHIPPLERSGLYQYGSHGTAPLIEA